MIVKQRLSFLLSGGSQATLAPLVILSDPVILFVSVGDYPAVS